MTRLSDHATELAPIGYMDCCVAIMSDGAVLRNLGAGWQTWKRVKAGVPPTDFAAKALAAYEARPAEFHAYILALAATCDLAHRAQLASLVGLMPDDPDAAYDSALSAYMVALRDYTQRALAEIACRQHAK